MVAVGLEGSWLTLSETGSNMTRSSWDEVLIKKRTLGYVLQWNYSRK